MSSTSTVALSPLYAVIDLGSNSFHMVITQQLGGTMQVVEKIKRKVRLAAGLDENNCLSDDSMAKGFSCLKFFAERLQTLPPENIRIVATATLRLASNRQYFIQQAEQILNHPIQLLSGIDEAKTIYRGVSYTSVKTGKRLVIDIGGASTEIIVGDGCTVDKAFSFDMGCVTFKEQFFIEQALSEAYFQQAVNAAKTLLTAHVNDYKNIGWQNVLGSSGTMQALAELLIYQQRKPVITLDFLYEIKQQLLSVEYIADITIAGLSEDRKPVIVSGVAILMAIFEVFAIKQLDLAQGALREGLLYDMLAQAQSADKNIAEHAISALQQSFNVDKKQGTRVKQQALFLYQQLAPTWQLPLTETETETSPLSSELMVLLASCQLHEIGIMLGYKYHQQHSQYILENADLLGFEYSERLLLVMLVKNYQGALDLALIEQVGYYFSDAKKLLAILRLAVILSARHVNDVAEFQANNQQENEARKIEVTANTASLVANTANDSICLTLPDKWQQQQTLLIDQLSQEVSYLKALDIDLQLLTQKG